VAGVLVAPQRRAHLVAVQAGHEHVEHHQVRLAGRDGRQGALAIGGGDDVEMRLQAARHHLQADGIVVDDQDRAEFAVTLRQQFGSGQVVHGSYGRKKPIASRMSRPVPVVLEGRRKKRRGTAKNFSFPAAGRASPGDS
jgi:hypothetical protein